MEFSHHSSNPLEVTTSDPTNVNYNRALGEAYADAQGDLPTAYECSSDPLAVWSNASDYRNHINEAVGTTVFPPRLGPFDVTPKAGGSRTGAARARIKELAMSDDELALVENDASTSEVRRVVKVEDEDEVKEEDEDDIIVEADSEANPEDMKIDEYDEPEGDFFDGEHFPEEDENEDQDEEMRSVKDSSRADSSLGSMSPLTPLSSKQSSPYSSPQSSRPPSPDEAQTLSLRPSEEQDEIHDEIDQLYASVPELTDEYDLVDRLGTGTFSSVYKAIDLTYNERYNEPWLGHHPPESSAHYLSAGPSYRGRGGRAARLKQGMDEDGDKEDSGSVGQVHGDVYVAVKRIYTTSGPERIRNELSILEDCRGCRHSSQIITAFRNNDQVVIVLPYHRNMDFREFYQSLHPEGIKCYFRCLFRALRDIHARGVIHRDVKPANFLYDPFTGIGTLCDFGLASRMEPSHRVQQQGKCLHDVFSEAEPHGRNRDVDPDLEHDVKQAQREARAKSNMAADKVGYPDQDRRPLSKANRAGTRGFRAPEVLLKCGSQTGAVDVWSAGVILLFFLTGKFPIFQSNDDIEGLMELALIMGRRNVEKVATLHGRTFSSNVPDLDQDGISWSQFVERLNPDIHTPKKYDMRFYPHNCKHRDGRDGRDALASMPPPARSSSPPTSSTDAPERPSKHAERYANPPTAERYGHVLKLAFHLLEQVLHFESTKRYTPRKVLYHQFLDEAGADGDDQFVPHRVGDGVCGRFHYRESDGTHCVRVERRCRCREPTEHGMSDGEEDGDGDEEHVFEDLVEVEAGRGIPIGTTPCEYHRDMDNYTVLQ